MKALTLFAGAGGADLGLQRAGFEHVRCIEFDKSAHATLCAAGFPGVLGDVRDPTLYRDLPPIDLLWASPPCQDWSRSGKREGAAGSRNGWPWTWAAVRHLQRRGLGPAWLIAENVPGMLMHSGKDCGKGCCADPTKCPTTYWHEVVMREARALFPWAGYRVIDAAAHGTPQFRRRVFLVAGPRPLRWPEPTHGQPTAQASLFGPGLKPYRTVRDALGLDVFALATAHGPGEVAAGRKVNKLSGRPALTVPAATLSPTAGGTVFVRTEQRGATATPDTMPAPTVPTVGNQYLHAGDPGVRLQREDPSRGWEDAAQPGPSPSVRSARPGGGLALTRAGSEPERLDRPAPCVTTTEAKGTRGDNMGRTLKSGGKAGGVDRAADAVWLATGRRRLTVRECAALFDMPPDYPWHGTKTSQYKQVGNMVAWKVAKALGDAVFSA